MLRMKKHYLLGPKYATLSPEAVQAALGLVGFTATRVSEVRLWGTGNLAFALYYQPERAPLFVDLTELTPDRDEAMSAWEMAEELTKDPIILDQVRCLIEVRHYEDADPTAVEAVLAFLRADNGVAA